MKIYALSMTLGVLIASSALAADANCVPAPEACKEVQTCGSSDCCAHCGNHACCEKYCKVVCEMKEVKKTVWVVKCSDFCAPLPACPLNSCDGCKSGCKDDSCTQCDGCSDKSCDPCASLENRNYRQPNCGKVRGKKTLEKKEITCKIPSYKCVVVYACAGCGCKLDDCQKSETQAPTNPNPTPAPKTTNVAPLPPIIDTAYVK
jgi:hypothetical protein